MSKVSAIIPTHNRSDWVSEAIKSVLSQTRTPDEVIIIDDGSTDDTEKKVASMAGVARSEIRYIYQTHQGVSAARNKGIREARYEYLAFLDSDDRWTKQKLTIQMAKMENNPDSLISYTGERWYRRGLHLNQKKQHQQTGGDIFEQSLKLCCVGMSTVIFHKNLIDQYGTFDETLPCCEDYDLWLRVASETTFLLIDQPLTVKNGGREDQLSFQYRVGMDKYRIKAIEKLLKNESLAGDKRQSAIKELVRKCEIYGNGCLKHDRETEGKEYLERANHYQWLSL
ncbi:MAG: glycosyltransferase family 2 protein [Desulfobulbaceae bacterium]|nr:MAG: glycosyltransferase family 2 protein [Desulfobulbaceae bacterium]